MYMAAASAQSTAPQEPIHQAVPIVHDTETESSTSDDMNSDDDKLSDKVPSITDYRRHKSRISRRESALGWAKSNALTSSASLSVLPSYPSDIHGPAGHEHSHPEGRPSMTRHRSSLFQEKPTLYNLQPVAQSDVHVNWTGLGERAMKSDMDLTRYQDDTHAFRGPFEKQPKPTKRQSVVGSFLSSLSTAMSSIGSRNSSKSKLQTASSLSVCNDSPSASSIPSDHHQKRNKRRFFYGLENSTTDFHSASNRASFGYPMSNPAMSKSTPALTSYAATPSRSQSYIFQPEGCCTCPNKNNRNSCLYHKALPSLPADKKEKKKPLRLSAVSTTSFKSSLSVRKSRPQLPSALFQTNSRLSGSISSTSDRNSRTSRDYGSKTSPPEHTENLPSPIIQRAIERHAGRSILPLANDSLRGVKGLSRRDHETRNHSVHNFGKRSPLLRTRHPVYRHALSVSSPCLPGAFDQDASKAVLPGKPGNRSLHSAVASNVQAQVSVINVRAEIIPPATAHTLQTDQPHKNERNPRRDSRPLSMSLGFNFTGRNQRGQEIPGSWGQEVTDSMAASVVSTPFEREKIPFFEPFQAEAQHPSYVSFHFDLSHLETQEIDSSATERTNGDGESSANRVDDDLKRSVPDESARALSTSAPSSVEIFTMMDLHASTPSTPVPSTSSKKRTLETQDPSPSSGNTANKDTPIASAARPLVIRDGRIVPKRKGRPPPPPRRPAHDPSSSSSSSEHDHDMNEVADSVAEQFQSLQEHLRKQGSSVPASHPKNKKQQQLLEDWTKSSQRNRYHKSTPCLPIASSEANPSTASPSLSKENKPFKSRWSWLWWGGRKQQKA
ncbi:hypothetical protein BGX31_002477 [Mortierella sp. GBA43]|nr:hypothetical protein BGX31_002477 [Mortierella sp. GBA43]